jgi:DNA polymerase-3 subunit delta
MDMSIKTHLLIGEDTYSVAKALEEFKSTLGAGELLEANFTSVEAGSITPGELGLIVSASPFLAPKRLVVIYGLSERFEGRPRRAKKTTKKSPEANEDLAAALADVISNRPDTTELVIVAGNIAAGNPLLKALGDEVERQNYPLLTGRNLEKWIAENVSSKGGKITAGGANMLVKLIGSDLWAMSTEIEKLTLFADGAAIDEKLIARMVQVSPESNIFHLIDAVVAGKASAAELELEKLISNGVSSSQIINMLARQMRMIAVAQDMLERGFRIADISKRLAIKHDFITQKVVQKARVLSVKSIRLFYQYLVKADLDIKTSKLEADIALSVLIERLAAITACAA